ncbi:MULTISPECIES: hypothetical protein [unclassified Bradyrhizobium]|uniref:hypothetical protein n=1 Tax=unclassified Bradyrhizobium TaxID=2631580 RepID=UPI0028EA64F0|nr:MULTISPECIES: hypothetical protein [unclassified Bradyrhizobium]
MGIETVAPGLQRALVLSGSAGNFDFPPLSKQAESLSRLRDKASKIPVVTIRRVAGRPPDGLKKTPPEEQSSGRATPPFVPLPPTLSDPDCRWVLTLIVATQPGLDSGAGSSLTQSMNAFRVISSRCRVDHELI